MFLPSVSSVSSYHQGNEQVSNCLDLWQWLEISTPFKPVGIYLCGLRGRLASSLIIPGQWSKQGSPRAEAGIVSLMGNLARVFGCALKLRFPSSNWQRVESLSLQSRRTQCPVQCKAKQKGKNWEINIQGLLPGAKHGDQTKHVSFEHLSMSVTVNHPC